MHISTFSNHKNEYSKGYKALDILTMIGYLCCAINLVMGFSIMFKGPLPGLLILVGSLIGFLVVYVFNKIGHAAFIARDCAITSLNRGG